MITSKQIEKIREGFSPILHHVTVADVIVFMLLAESGDDGILGSRLAEKAGLSLTQIINVIDKLEANELTQRRPLVEDRRAKALSLTPNGKNFYKKIFAS